MSSPPLAHLRIVDLTDLCGALAGRILGELGADVIKVESPDGDPGRLRPPFAGGAAVADRSLPFLYRNANKRGTVIDAETPAGRARLAALCDEADVLLENLHPTQRARSALLPDTVQARHPHLVHVIMADFGLSGPRANWHAEPLVAFAASGALHASGLPDRPPCWLPGFIAHDCAAVFAVLGALTAVCDRHRHGYGQTVEVSVQEAAIHGLNPWAIPLEDYTRLYPLVPKSPPRNGDGAYLVLKTVDGYVRILAGTQRHWKAFVALIGAPEALAGPEWENAIFRLLNVDAIRLIAADSLKDRRRAEVFASAQRLGLPLAPVNTPDEFVHEEQTVARGYFQRTTFPHLAGAPFAPLPLNFSVTPAVLRHPAPALGTPSTDHRTPAGAPDVKPTFGNRCSVVGAPASASPASSASDAPLLAGLRVVDLGVGAVGPEVCWVLAELGAEVIKIESRTSPDFLRAVTIEPDQPNRSWTFNDESRGQRSVCLDLRTPRGREIALRLCAGADVVVENNRGGVVEKWGLDYAAVRGVRPDVIYVVSQGFGRGPLGTAPAFGPLNSSFAGANWLWNHADAPYPAGSSLNHPDHVASKLAAIGVLAALEHRRRSGAGQLIEMAQTEAAAYFLGEFYLQSACTGAPPQQRGNEVDYAVPHGVYPCAGDDRWCAIAVVGDQAWERFCDCLGWPREPRYRRLDDRVEARREIEARVAEWTKTRTATEIATLLQNAGVSAIEVQSPDDTRTDAHLLARGAIVTVEHPEIGPERHIGNPIRMSRTPLVTAGPAPLLGADTEDVLTRWLGLNCDAVAQLVREGVCR